MKRTIALTAFLPVLLSGSAQTIITVDMTKEAGRIPPLIYGAGAEDVNHEIYGGLYDQRIFGESFEEPAVTWIENFVCHDAPWCVRNNEMSADAHAKAIYDRKAMQKGKAEVELRHSGSNTIAGFIINVSEAGGGYDNFRGYEISLNAPARTLVVGKHDHNWQPIANVPVTFNPADWNKLRVDFDGGAISIMLNGKQVYVLNDADQPLKDGKVGLRTFDGGASFRNLKIDGTTVPLTAKTTGVSGMWEPVGSGKYSHHDTNAFNGSHYQRIEGSKDDGICNRGLNRWGIGIESGKKMSGYVYLRGTAGKAYAALQSTDGTKEYGRATLTGISDDWNRFEFNITPAATDHDARFVVGLGSEGTLDVDMAMLHTDSYPYRNDLTEAFKKEGLTFLRYGGTMINAPEYMTGNMTGPQELRAPYTGHWYRYSTNGFGIMEFVDFAKLIGTEPTFSINIEDNPTDVLALLKKIEHHGLKYIEIGNEENIGNESHEAYEHYVERFNTLYDAIHPVYPDLVFINAAWWRPDRPELMEYVFRNLDGKSALWDYHPWTDEVNQAKDVERELLNMKRLFIQWNPATDMHVAILEENGNTHSMHRALSHAIVLNIVRRMNGFVELDSPANALQPYRQNDNGWDQGQIFFNSHTTWCQPPYYAQQMAASKHQPVLLETTSDNTSLDICATRSEDGKRMVMHIVNPGSEPHPISINLHNSGDVKSISGISLSGDLADINTPGNPERIVPQELTLAAPELSLKPYSYTILELTCD